MKAQLVFNLPQEQEEFENALNGSENLYKLHEIHEQLFRPFYKHGYANDRLNQLLLDKKCVELYTIFSNMYSDIVRPL